jgi:arylformamidase
MLDIDMRRYRVVDLSYEVMPGQDDERPFDMSLGRLADGTFRYDITRTHSHVGTHVESPWHFYKAGKTITDFPVSAFMGRAALLPFSLPEGQLEISPSYVDAEIGGLLREGDIVIFHNAHNKNLRQGQVPDSALKTVPFVTEETAVWLRDRKIKLFGFDILRLGETVETGRTIHDIFLSRDICIVEWLDHLDELDTREFYFMALPFKVRGIDSGVARAVGVVERAQASRARRAPQ